jgi:hypothetical protein
MMEEVAEFGEDAFQTMAGGTVNLSPLAASEFVALRCPICLFEFFANIRGMDDITCPSCTAIHKQNEWRSPRKNNAYDLDVPHVTPSKRTHKEDEANVELECILFDG